MRIEAICFTNAGFLLGEKLISSLSKCCEAAELSKGFGENGVSLGEWVKTRFNTADALVFIGSAAIAVRAIAPYISLKTTDPAVIAIDEKANFCIPLLSGHIGGANELSKKLAELTGAVPVITTATDINNLFAIDSWAVKNSIAIINPEKIKTVSSKLLAGRIVKLKSDFDIIGRLPDGFEISENDFDAIITSSYSENTNALCLVPPVAVIGVGCKRGSSQDKIENAVLQVLKKAGVYPQAVASICSINIKSDEAGII
ncbi:MAG TPA: cobalamin biosynthesis protein CbiG, partial [Ruminococcaceae bacterium]|nr:cobalamin biosynthesis protein CbiG [Oscillospiraceae bacterium]